MHACGEKTNNVNERKLEKKEPFCDVYVCNSFLMFVFIEWISAELYVSCLFPEMSVLLCVSSAIMLLHRKLISTCTFEHILERNLSSATSVARHFAHKVILQSSGFNSGLFDFQFFF